MLTNTLALKRAHQTDIKQPVCIYETIITFTTFFRAKYKR